MSIESRNVTLYCPNCGNDQFSTLDNDVDGPSDDIKYQCSDCKLIITKSELIDANQDVINANIEDIKQEAVNELEKSLKKAFKGGIIKWK